MKLLIVISKGKAIIAGNDLRCAAPRVSDTKRICNKLLTKRNDMGQVAGAFKCERCNQIVEVKLVEPAERIK